MPSRMIFFTLMLSCFSICEFLIFIREVCLHLQRTCLVELSEKTIGCFCKGAGRGFCAGGDVATVYHLGKAG